MAKKKAATTAKKKTTTKKKTTRRKKGEPTPEEAWNLLKEEVGVEQVASYAMKSQFQAKSAIEHPKFGLGIVTEVYPSKIEVTFKEGAKVLVHNRA